MIPAVVLPRTHTGQTPVVVAGQVSPARDAGYPPAMRAKTMFYAAAGFVAIRLGKTLAKRRVRDAWHADRG